MKKNFSIFSLSVFLILSITSCREQLQLDYQKITGETMGTYYQVQYETKTGTNLKPAVDSLLLVFNNSLSTYIESSTISRINQAAFMYCYSMKEDQYFLYSWKKAEELSRLTAGAFEPTIMPLVNYWGFGYSKKEKVSQPDQKLIDSLLQLVGTSKINFEEKADSVCFFKRYPGVQIDLSASAKGHGVDVIADFLSSLGIDNYYVEIGGEVRASGVNPRNEPWSVGVNRPSEDAGLDEIEIVLSLQNKALATSGNYRNFYKTENGKASHIIDPNTGMARATDVLSATVLADDCLTADAVATACMVLGWEKAAAIVEELKGVEVFLIYSTSDNEGLQYYYSEGFKSLVK